MGKGDISETVSERGQSSLDDVLSAPIPESGRVSPAQSRRSLRKQFEVVKMADVQPESIEWLWEGRIPRGCLTVLDGDPGLGKSTLVCELAACLSRGRLLPGQRQAVRAGVLIVNAEDHIGATIRARLDAAGADLDHVWAVRRPDLQICDDLPEIEDIVATRSVGLLVLDPLMAFLGNKTNTFKDHDVRRALAPLAAMAERLRMAVLVVRHLNKAIGGPALYRGGGSIGIIGAARSGLILGRDPDEPDSDRRILATSKSNLSLPPRSLRLRIPPAEGVSRVEWLGECDLAADQLVSLPESEADRSALEDAKDFLKEQCAQEGKEAAELYRLGKEQGISDRTLRRARRALGGSKGRLWTLPTNSQPTGQS